MKAIKTTIAQNGIGLYIKSMIAGITGGGIIIVLLMCITSVILLISGNLPHSLIRWILLGICCISVLAGGYIAAKVNKEKGMIVGMMTGLFMFIIVLCSGLLYSDGIFTYMTLIKLVAFITMGAVGGIKGVNQKEKLHIK